MLLGLVLGAFIDYRVDDVVVQPGAVTNIPGTPYAVRLDAVEDQRATVALLRQTETVAQGSIGEKQPLHDGVAVYLDRIGPALKVSADARRDADVEFAKHGHQSRCRQQVLLLFTSDQNEGFLAAPQVNLVLRVQPIAAGSLYRADLSKRHRQRLRQPIV